MPFDFKTTERFLKGPIKSRLRPVGLHARIFTAAGIDNRSAAGPAAAGGPASGVDAWGLVANRFYRQPRPSGTMLMKPHRYNSH